MVEKIGGRRMNEDFTYSPKRVSYLRRLDCGLYDSFSGFAVQIAYGEEGHRADITGNSETDS